MTPDKTPTDAELRALAVIDGGMLQDDRTANWFVTDADLLAFARAVLAKWGSPVVAGEHVGKAMSLPGAVGFTMACFHSDLVPLGTKLYTTPQPTQAQAGAVPLTDEQIEAIATPFITRVGSHWEHDDAIPDNGRIEEFARAIEAAHGIKEGGQHAE